METTNNFGFKEINEEEKKYKFKNVLESKLFKRLQNYLLIIIFGYSPFHQKL